LDLVNLSPLMERTTGRADLVVALIDGPVAGGHPDLVGGSIRGVAGHEASCSRSTSVACAHGTFVAGILAGRRGSVAPAICPGCILLVRPIFPDTGAGTQMPSATREELAAAIVESIEAGARVINVSAALTAGSSSRGRALEQALDLSRHRGVIVVAAAGNRSMVGGTDITGHPWVIPAVGYDASGRPSRLSSFGDSIGRRGLGAPGEGVVSLAPPATTAVYGGTSVAAPFVTGAIALLCSEFPRAAAADVWIAVTQGVAGRRRSVVPPLLDAWGAYGFLRTLRGR
jgi:subtilisin family serine protease